jgi:hypothetical protein
MSMQIDIRAPSNLNVEKELSENITKFVFDLMKIKSQIIDQSVMMNYPDKKEKQMKLLYETLQFYSRNKKILLDETFEVKQLFEKNDDSKGVDISSCDGDTDVSSASDPNTSDSETVSEYAFSDVDDNDTEDVNKLMACAFITLRRARQSKIGLRINKKTLT